MNYEVLHFKLALRRTLLKQRERQIYRGSLLHRFSTVPLAVFDETIAECTKEGLLSSSIGERGAVIYTWHEEKVAAV